MDQIEFRINREVQVDQIENVPQYIDCFYQVTELMKFLGMIESLLIFCNPMIKKNKKNQEQINKFCQRLLDFREINLEIVEVFSIIKAKQLDQKNIFYQKAQNCFENDDDYMINFAQNHLSKESVLLLKFLQHCKKKDSEILQIYRNIQNAYEFIPPIGTEQIITQFFKKHLLQNKKIQQYCNKQIKHELKCELKYKIICFVEVLLFVSTVVLLSVLVLYQQDIKQQLKFEQHFPAWRGLLLLITYFVALGINLLVFQSCGINFIEIMDLKYHGISNNSNLIKLSCFLVVIYLVFLTAYFITLAGHIESIPQILLGASWFIIFFVLFFPTSFKPINDRTTGTIIMHLIFFNMIVHYFQKGVDYSANWLSQQLSSFRIFFSDLVYVIRLFLFGYRVQNTTFASLIGGIIGSIIFLIRIAQAFRRCCEEKQYWRYLFGSIKCFLGILAIWAVYIYREYQSIKDRINANEMSLGIVLLTIGSISSLFASFFDLFFDWEIIKFSKKTATFSLRQQRVYTKKTQILICILAIMLRFSWILILETDGFFIVRTNQKQRRFLDLFIGIGEIIRRGLWNLLVFQKTHLKNYFEKTNITEIEHNLIQQCKKIAPNSRIWAHYEQKSQQFESQKKKLWQLLFKRQDMNKNYTSNNLNILRRLKPKKKINLN